MDRFLLLLTGASAVGSLIVTAVYTRLTYKILKENEKSVALSELQIRSQSRPYITIRSLNRPASQMFQLSIVNTGHTAAKNLKLSISPDFHRFGIAKEDESLQNEPIFKYPTECFPPGMELIYDLAISHELNRPELTKISPKLFTVTAAYSGDVESYDEKTVIDLAVYGKTTIGSYGPTYELMQIKDNLKNIAETLNRIGHKED
jgi:hypothetical protein